MILEALRCFNRAECRPGERVRQVALYTSEGVGMESQAGEGPQTPKIGLVQAQETDLGNEELQGVEKLQQGYHNMKSELGKVIVGQEAVIEELLIALFCR